LHPAAGDPSLFQRPQAVQLAGRLDDPRQRQLAEHLAPARRSVEPQLVVTMRQGGPRAPHPPRRDRQRAVTRAPPGGLGALKAQAELFLPGGQPLPRGRLQQLQLGVVMREADALVVPGFPVEESRQAANQQVSAMGHTKIRDRERSQVPTRSSPGFRCEIRSHP
jgi:hypothetical protein